MEKKPSCAYLERPVEDRKADIVRALRADENKDRVPVIVQRAEGCKLQDIPRSKYLVQQDMQVRHLMHMIRRQIRLSPEQGLFTIMVTPSGQLMPCMSSSMKEIHETHQQPCGALVFLYRSESTFG